MRGRSLTNLVLISGFAAICIAGIGYLAVNMGFQVPGQPGYRLRAVFDTQEGLVSQSEVRVSGVKVGEVVDVSSAPSGEALVAMRIDPSVKLRSDVRALVRPKSLLGEKFVELVRKPGSSAPIAADGFTIPKAQTGQAVEIDDVLNNMDPETRAAFSESLRQLGVALKGRADDVNQSIPNVDATAANLRPLARTADARQKEIDRILTDLAIIMAALADEQDALGHIVVSGNTVMGAMARRDHELAGTVVEANRLFTSLDTAFADLTPADRASLQKSPATIASGRTLLSLTNPEIDRLLPEILLAQVNYPNNQLNVSHEASLTLAREWMSAFAQQDPPGGNHALRVTNVAGPGSYVGGGAPALPAEAPLGPPPGSIGLVPDSSAGSGGGGLPPAVWKLLMGGR
jgi:virulence factor Mce-like protein